MNRLRAGDGFTLIEVLVAMAILGVLGGIGVYSYLQAINPPREIAKTVHGRLLSIRADAMANTQARRVLLTGQSLTVQAAPRCSQSDPEQWSPVGVIAFDTVQRQDTVNLSTVDATGVPDPSLPTGAKLLTCFTSRGLAMAPAGQTLAALIISDPRRTYNVEIALGGAVRTRVP